MSKYLFPITVRRKYNDQRYRDYLRRAFKLEYSGDRRGRSPYYFQVIKPLLSGASGDMHYEDGTAFEPSFEQLEGDLKQLTDFIGKAYSERKGYSFLLPIVDAFMQLQIPGFDSAFKNQSNSDAVGLVFGEFLRDETSHMDRGQLAINHQEILGIYIYEEVDTYQATVDQKRVLALLSGKNIDYLLVVDSPLSLLTNNTFGRHDRSLDLLTGFCIPGEAFSPVLLRTPMFRMRQMGLLYAPGHLIETFGEALDDLSYEVFSTDASVRGSVQADGKYGKDSLIADALDIYFGPKLRRKLEKVPEGALKSKISKKIERLRADVL